MYIFFVVLIVFAAILMIGIVLIQESKGGGLASGFSSGNQMLGVRKTTDVVEKTTWSLAAAMVIISIFCAYSKPDGASKSVAEGAAAQTEQSNPVNKPGFGADPTGTPAAPAATPAAPADAKATTEAAPAPEAKADVKDANAEEKPAEKDAKAEEKAEK